MLRGAVVKRERGNFTSQRLAILGRHERGGGDFYEPEARNTSTFFFTSRRLVILRRHERRGGGDFYEPKARNTSTLFFYEPEGRNTGDGASGGGNPVE